MSDSMVLTRNSQNLCNPDIAVLKQNQRTSAPTLQIVSGESQTALSVISNHTQDLKQ